MYRLIILLLILASSIQASDLKLKTELSYEILTPASQQEDKLQDFHIKGLQLFDSVLYFKTTTSESAVTYKDNLDGPLSSKTLLAIQSSSIKDQLLKYYETRLSVNFTDTNTSTDNYDFTWKESPSYDDYNNTYSLNFLITKDDLPYWEYMKIVFLHSEGFVCLEWDQPYQANSELLFNSLKNTTQIKDEFKYSKELVGPIPQSNKTLKKVILPIYSESLTPDIQDNNTSVFEKNKRLIGLGVLVFSMIFFVFLAPQSK